MASERQIKANRRNAKNSTGPRTDAGKKASARNSLKHGVLSEKTVSGYEDYEAYDRLLNRLAEDLRPETVLELTLVERLANLFWRERRLADAEAIALTIRHIEADSPRMPDFKKFVPLSDQFLIGRYQGMLGRQIRETLADLREEQALRLNAIEATAAALPEPDA